MGEEEHWEKGWGGRGGRGSERVSRPDGFPVNVIREKSKSKAGQSWWLRDQEWGEFSGRFCVCSPGDGNTGHVLACSMLMTDLKEFNTEDSRTCLLVYAWIQSEWQGSPWSWWGYPVTGSLARSFHPFKHPELLGKKSPEVMGIVGFLRRRELWLRPQRKLLILGSQLHSAIFPTVTLDRWWQMYCGVQTWSLQWGPSMRVTVAKLGMRERGSWRLDRRDNGTGKSQSENHTAREKGPMDPLNQG